MLLRAATYTEEVSRIDFFVSKVEFGKLAFRMVYVEDEGGIVADASLAHIHYNLADESTRDGSTEVMSTG